MRWSRAVAVAVVVVALAACGGGDKKTNAAATGSGTNGSKLSAGSGAPGATDSGSAATASSGAGESPVVSADSTGSNPGGGQAPSNTDAPTPVGLKPFAGHYRYQLTGQGAPSEIVTTIEDLNDTDQRNTTPGGGGQGDTIQTLRFLPNQIELESLEMKGAFPKTFNGPVMFVPIPSDVGATWEWDLTSTDNLTHVHQSSTIDRTETVVVGGQSVETFVVETDLKITGDVNATGHVTSWASPVYKLSVRIHNILNVTTPVQVNSDITSDLLDLRPS